MNQTDGNPAWEAPYRFRHGALAELRDFLVQEKRAGRFHPRFPGGLDDYN